MWKSSARTYFQTGRYASTCWLSMQVAYRRSIANLNPVRYRGSRLHTRGLHIPHTTVSCGRDAKFAGVSVFKLNLKLSRSVLQSRQLQTKPALQQAPGSSRVFSTMQKPHQVQRLSLHAPYLGETGPVFRVAEAAV